MLPKENFLVDPLIYENVDTRICQSGYNIQLPNKPNSFVCSKHKQATLKEKIT